MTLDQFDAEGIIWVTQEELDSEKNLVATLSLDLKNMRSSYFSTVRSFRELYRERNKIMQRIPMIDLISRIGLYARARAIEETAQSRRENMAIVRDSIGNILDRINKEVERILHNRVKKPPPGPPGVFWTRESITGYEIYWFEDGETYVVWDPKAKAIVRMEDSIVIELTGSLDTDTGHDVPLVVEVTATTYVTGISPEDIESITSKRGPLEGGLIKWLISKDWGFIIDAWMRTGLSYNGRMLIEERHWYPYDVPAWTKVHALVERSSKYVPDRSYEDTFDAQHPPEEKEE